MESPETALVDVNVNVSVNVIVIVIVYLTIMTNKAAFKI